MFRLTAPLAIAAIAASAATAQTAPTPAPAPAPAATGMSAAEKNAIITAPLPEDQAAMKSHVMFLASDPMRGRDAGSNEYDIAAQYVASQFYAQGLRPAGDAGGYLQKVPLVAYNAADKGSMVVSRKGGDPVALAFGQDFIPGAVPASPSFTLTAPVVFVGYGIVGVGRDDYKGADVKGKIVAFFGGAPSSFPGEERAHFGSPASKAEIAMRKGAVGYITLESPITARSRPFAMLSSFWDRPRVTWADANGVGHIPTPATPGLGALSMAGAAKLFAGTPGAWDAIRKAAEVDGATFKPVQLPGTLTVSLKTASKPLTSYNVAGLLPGSDPKLKDEVVVLTAHLDHVGVGRPDRKGDTIYNGAMDNAVGVASLIEEAKRFKASGKAPRRSVLFLAVTAEEKGLVGADYFANNPTLPKASLVADVNLDMPIITYKFSDIVVFGAPRSTLGPIVQKAAAEIGVTISPDPMPEEGLFVRSDHYRFVQQGIPSVFLWPGQAGPGKEATERFMKEHYHQASDEVAQEPGIDWESGVRFVDVNYRIARAIADADQRPVWNKGDFFGTFFGGPVAR